MSMTAGPTYTFGTWRVRAGHEEDFVAAWCALSDVALTVPGSGWGKLLRDHDDPSRFVSFGAWRDVEAIAAWRGHPDFQRVVVRIRGFVESFTPHTMEPVAEAGPATPDPSPSGEAADEAAGRTPVRAGTTSAT